MPIPRTPKSPRVKKEVLKYPFFFEKRNILQSRKLVSADRKILNDFIDDEYPALRLLYKVEKRADSKEVKLDGWLSSTNKALKKVKKKFSRAIDKTFGETWFNKSSKVQYKTSQNKWFSLISKAFGILYRKPERWSTDFLDNYVTKNVRLITKLSDEVFEQVDATVKIAIQNNLSKKDLRNMLISQTDLQPLYSDVSGFNYNTSSIRKLKNRAELIASDQIGTFQAQLNEQRQKDAGIKGYIWRNSQDRRVRGNPNGIYPNSKYNHWNREGKKYLWEARKKVPDGYNNPPPDGHPGIPIRCRGTAQPDLDWVEADEFGELEGKEVNE